MKLSIKSTLPLLVLALGCATASRAADDNTIAVVPETPAKSPEAAHGHDGKHMQAALDQRLQQLDQTLQLTFDQKQKIRAVWAKQFESMKDASPQERRSKGMEAFKAARDEVRALLTPEQQTKFDAMKPEWQDRKGKGKKAP